MIDISSKIDNQLYSQLSNQLDNQLYAQLYNQLYDQLRSQLSNQLYDQLNWPTRQLGNIHKSVLQAYGEGNVKEGEI